MTFDLIVYVQMFSLIAFGVCCYFYPMSIKEPAWLKSTKDAVSGFFFDLMLAITGDSFWHRFVHHTRQKDALITMRRM